MTAPWLAGATVAVTGASGFCGAAVARAAAAAGATVVGLGRRPGPVGTHRPWDAAAGAPDLGGVDAVVHLAAAVGDPGGGRGADAAFRAVNVDGAARLLEAAGARPVVWVSSASVYDPRLDRSRVTEDHPLAGQLNAYARTKAAGDVLAQRAGAVVLRPHAVYGPGDRHLLPRLRRAVRLGRVLLPGPDVRISLTAVENLADACLLGTRWPPGAYNVADATAYDRDEVVADVLAAAGRAVRVRHVPLAVAEGAARVLGRLPLRAPLLTPYAVDQVGHTVVLDTGRAAAQGYAPRRTVADYLTGLRAAR